MVASTSTGITKRRLALASNVVSKDHIPGPAIPNHVPKAVVPDDIEVVLLPTRYLIILILVHSKNYLFITSEKKLLDRRAMVYSTLDRLFYS